MYMGHRYEGKPKNLRIRRRCILKMETVAPCPAYKGASQSLCKEFTKRQTLAAVKILFTEEFRISRTL